MKILVFIKQVPATSTVEVDPVTGVLKRDGVDSKMNPYDLFALEAGISVREKCGGELTAITMGPGQATSVLKEALSIGADRGILLSDRRLAGADVLATSRALSSGAKLANGFDLIICGKQTTDGDTAQVGPELAELLGIPHAVSVTSVNADSDGVTVSVNGDFEKMTLFLPFPCLITMEKDSNTPRLPSYKKAKGFSQDAIAVYGLDDFADKDEQNYGLKGSPTQVERIFPPEKGKDRVIYNGDDPAGKLFSLLAEKKFI